MSLLYSIQNVSVSQQVIKKFTFLFNLKDQSKICDVFLNIIGANVLKTNTPGYTTQNSLQTTLLPTPNRRTMFQKGAVFLEKPLQL